MERTDETGVSWWRTMLGVGAVAGLAYLAWAIWRHEVWIAWMERSNPLVFFVVMALLPAVGFPITPLFVLAGATFGTTIGLVGSALALGVNLALCYVVAHGRARPWLAGLLRRFGNELPSFEGAPRRAARFTIMVKLAPGVPAFAKNYGLGIAGVPFVLYFGVSMVLTGAYGLALVVVGDSLLDHDFGRLPWVLGALAILGGALALFRRRSARPA